MKQTRSPYLLGLSLAAACASRPGTLADAPSPPAVDEASDSMATCKVAKDPENPFIVEWSGAHVADLEAKARSSVVVVSYVGCYLKILEGCTAKGAYGYAPLTLQRDGLTIATKSELYAALPLGAARLSAELGEAQELKLDYALVGQKAVDAAPVEFRGDCEGMTHYVRTMTLGAFSLEAVASSRVGGGASVMGVGGGARAETGTKKLRSAGDLASCAAEPGRCSAILKLGLARLGPVVTGVSVSSGGSVGAGFGAGLGGLSAVPEVGALRTEASGADFQGVDPAKLRLLQEARKADRSEGLVAEQRATAWESLARYSGGQHDLAPQAKERAARWRAVGRAERQRCRELSKVRDRKATDERKLAELLALDDETLPAAQKAAYRAELDRAYGRWERPLQDLTGKCVALAAAIPTGVVDMVDVPAGEFWMGCNSDVDNECDGEEKPGRKVRVNAFAIDRTEVTVAAYGACVKEGKCSAPGGGSEAGREEHPVTEVSWDDARAFCAWAGKRLPTEAEWEKAARGTDGRKYPWGGATDFTRRANLSGGGDGFDRTAPVGIFTGGASPYEALDMAGNVWEWTSDWHEVNSSRVVRGGSWGYDPRYARASYRYGYAPVGRYDSLGFRCAQ